MAMQQSFRPTSRAALPHPALTARTARPRLARVRDRILAAARAVLVSESYDGLSLAAVASAAGVTRRTLYNQFTDKAEIYRTSRTELIQGLADVIGAEVPPRMRPVDGLRYFAELAHDVFADPRNIELVRSMIRDAAAQPWLAEHYERHIRQPLRRTCENYVLRHLPRARGAADARDISERLVTVLDAIAAGPQLLADQPAALAGRGDERAMIAACYARLLDA